MISQGNVNQQLVTSTIFYVQFLAIFFMILIFIFNYEILCRNESNCMEMSSSPLHLNDVKPHLSKIYSMPTEPRNVKCKSKTVEITSNRSKLARKPYDKLLFQLKATYCKCIFPFIRRRKSHKETKLSK